MKKAYIAGGIRTPFVKSLGAYAGVKLQGLMTETLNHLVLKYNLEGKIIGDVGIGAVLKSAKVWNLARECVLGTKLDPSTPAFNFQRACGTGLDITGVIALKIMAEEIGVGIAGGADTNSDIALELPYEMTQKILKFRNAKSSSEKLQILLSLRPSDFIPESPWIVEPRTGLSMGEHCELMVKEWKIPRAAQDEFALASHQKAAKAYQEGFFDDLVFEFQKVNKDLFVRADTSLEKLQKLAPAFDKSPAGTLTAGNSSPLSDGAAAVLLANEETAKLWNLPILAEFVDMEVAGVDYLGDDGLLMAPTIAVAKLLARNNLKLQDLDVYEFHEAFAGQVLCTFKAWESDEYCRKRLGLDKALGSIDQSKVNLKGGSVALGHPFAATGCRQVATLAKILSGRKNALGLISMCTGGGMGVAALLRGY